MTDKLKPCPAGHSATLKENMDGRSWVSCDDEGCSWLMEVKLTPEDAVSVWNDRSEDAEIERLRKEVEELKEEISELTDDD